MLSKSVKEQIRDLARLSERLNTNGGEETPLVFDDALLTCLRKIQTPYDQRLAETRRNGKLQ